MVALIILFFLKDFVREVVGDKIRLIDPSKEAVLEIKEILKQRGCLNVDRQKEYLHKFFVSGHRPDSKLVAEKLLGKKIDKVEQHIQL